MKLKRYQENAIQILKNFLAEANKVGGKYAFIGTTGSPYKSDYYDEIPFVCIKMPTGAGKTFVACHSIGEIMDISLTNKLGKGIVLWLVPSEAIKSQTLTKLNNRKDAHRQVLDDYFDNGVRIFSNEEALSIRREDVENNLCILVSTIDAFRKDKKIQSRYKIYQENGAFLNFFPEDRRNNDLEKDEHDEIIASLANVIRIYKPLIVIDEGHRAKTELSIEFLKDLQPSFIIEYTATPRAESNVLVQIHASELKEEKMIKIPIVLESVTQWQQAVKNGVLRRNELERAAKGHKTEYIRPIALLQAEQEKESTVKVTVDELKDFLIKECEVLGEEIAIKTSSRNDLENVDLFSRKCKIRYIITVNALAEGWDCAFAYILISVANIGSRIAVEQIIGRILRLPYASEKPNKELNFSYIFASAKNFNEAADEIVKGLETNGYSKYDLVSASAKKETDELTTERKIKESIEIPIMALDKEELEFASLIGDDFKLAEQEHKFDFKTHYDSEGRVLIDIKENDKWVKERQATLSVTYEDKNMSKADLVNWLDKKLRFIMLEKVDKAKFIAKAVDYQLNTYNLTELSVNRFVLRDRLDEVIRGILIEYARKRFDVFLKKGEISIKNFEKFPDKIVLIDKLPDKFNKSYYEGVDKLNKEELNFVIRLDSDALPNIRFWVRNREKKDPFYLQGWKPNRYYPDFIAFTKSGHVIALEWKGEDRLSNEDTTYKVEIAKIWERLSKGKQHFYLVNNKNVESVLNEIKKL